MSRARDSWSQEDTWDVVVSVGTGRVTVHPEASCVCRFLAPVTFKGTLAHHVVLNPLVSEALPSGRGIQS